MPALFAQCVHQVLCTFCQHASALALTAPRTTRQIAGAHYLCHGSLSPWTVDEEDDLRTFVGEHGWVCTDDLVSDPVHNTQNQRTEPPQSAAALAKHGSVLILNHILSGISGINC